MFYDKCFFAVLLRWRRCFPLGILFGFFFSASISANADQADIFINKASELDIAFSEMWIKLLHYEKDQSSPSGFRSAIASDEFFLSENGEVDPVGELSATIKGIFQVVGADNDSHTQCVFHARYLWLSEILDFELAPMPKAKCERYNQWSMGGDITSISLLYATGYLGNPASYYGHTLLKFNTNDVAQSKLLDVSINYGAIVPSNEDPISYILKGAFGGYDGGFSHIEFYYHNHNYGELELRDIWEYEVGLSDMEVQLIVAHLWELMRKKYTYYFFRKNCAYRIAEILELAEGLNIIPDNRPWTFPQKIAENLSKVERNEQSLVTSITYHPSRQSRLYRKYEELSDREKNAVAEIVADINVLNKERYNQLNTRSKQVVLGVLEDYFQFASGGKVSEKNKYTKVLAKHFELPILPIPEDSYDVQPPHQGRSPGMIRVGYIDNESLGNGYEMVVRPSYYDVLDGGSGHVFNSSLTMFDTKFVYQNDKFNLRYLDFMSIESVSGGKTGLPKDRGKSWKIKLGIEQQNLNCTNCIVGRLQGDIGYARNIAGNNVVGMYVGLGLQNNRNGYGAAYGKSTWFANVSFSEKIKARIQSEHRFHFDSKEKNEDVYLLESRYKLDKNWDLRFQFEKNKGDEYTLSVGYYW